MVVELGQRGCVIACLGIFHRQAVAGEGVVGVFGEHLLESGDAVHERVVSG